MEPLQWNDGRVVSATAEGGYIITSPNADFIPIPLFGVCTVSSEPDGHFGQADPLLNPQVLIEGSVFGWLVAIERMPTSSSHPRFALWRALSREDIVYSNALSEQDIGCVAPLVLQPLADIVEDVKIIVQAFESKHGRHRELTWLWDAMQFAFQRLDFPASFRDLVRQLACFRRYTLYIYAWFQWHVAIKAHFDSPAIPRLEFGELMGCFTLAPLVAQDLFRSNVPVWFICRPEHIQSKRILKRRVTTRPPLRHLPMTEELVALLDPQLSGQYVDTLLVGDTHIAWINRQSSVYSDIEKRPHAIVSTDDSTPQASKELPSRSQNDVRHHPCTSLSTCLVLTNYPIDPLTRMDIHARIRQKLSPSDQSKFEPLSHPCIAQAVSTWEAALGKVDKVRKVAESSCWGCWVPDVRLFISTDHEDRKKRYLFNWLRVRNKWLPLLATSLLSSMLVPPKPTHWRGYLGSSPQSRMQASQPTKRGKQNRDIVSLFTSLLGSDVLFDAGESRVDWLERIVTWDELGSKQLSREVTWELCEVGFRMELTEMDRCLVLYSEASKEDERAALLAKVFPSAHDPFPKSIPSSSDGLAAQSRQQQLVFLEALRGVVLRWPNVPAALVHSAPFPTLPSTILVERLEDVLLHYYCQMFLDVSGRAPVIPRRIQ
ncbi:hypothetical protein EIP86_006216 [Pleurotus ostreatoroseus]|nr:hypothetical protein EIP86_006216 [Pleurotus ostreatoroseus]